MGLVGLDDAGIWSVAWAMFAAVAGAGLAAAAIALWRRSARADEPDFAVGWNALAPIVDR